MGRSDPRIHKALRKEHGGRKRGFGMNDIKYINPFSLFISCIECYNCGNFEHKATFVVIAK